MSCGRVCDWTCAFSSHNSLHVQTGLAFEGTGPELTQVKRLLKDPTELCCPLSYELMEHPVVAADGITYEKSWVEEQLKRVPGKSPTTGLPIYNTAPRQASLQVDEWGTLCFTSDA